MAAVHPTRAACCRALISVLGLWLACACACTPTGTEPSPDHKTQPQPTTAPSPAAPATPSAVAAPSDAPDLAQYKQWLGEGHDCFLTSDVIEPPALEARLRLDQHHELLVLSCQQASGAYNMASVALVLRDGQPLPEVPGIQEAGEQGYDPKPGAVLYGVAATDQPDGVVLNEDYKARGLGDGGTQASYRWRAGRFQLIERRQRESGELYPNVELSYPIVAPAEKRCSYRFESLDPERNAVTLVLLQNRSRRATRVISLAKNDRECELQGEATIACGAVEYQVVADGKDWHVLRLDGADAAPVVHASVARGCAL